MLDLLINMKKEFISMPKSGAKMKNNTQSHQVDFNRFIPFSLGLKRTSNQKCPKLTNYFFQVHFTLKILE